jgi:D-inositol-3-phosphate glycosyltransferase
MLRIGVVMYQTSSTKGQELVAERMTREFRVQGHEAFLITSAYNDWEATVTEEDIEDHGGYVHLFDEELGIPVIRVRSKVTSWPPRRVAFVDFMATLTNLVYELKLDVLISHSTLWNGPEEVLKFVEWRRSLAKEGGPLGQVAFCHMSHFQEPDSERYEMVERSYRETWNKVSLAQIARQADLILATTPIEIGQMVALGAPEERCFLFPGGIEDTSYTPSTPARSLKSLSGLSGKKVVTTLGTIEERKNILTVLEVARKLAKRSDIHFVIAGRVEGEYGRGCADAAARLPNVTFLGEVSDEEKLSLIRSSFLELTMSRAEALGLTQLEFLAEGVPVVTSGSGGQSWIVRGGVNGVVVHGPDDVEGAAAAIVMLARDGPPYRKMVDSARRSARPFTMPRLIRRLSNRLEDILETFSPHSDLMRGAPPDEKALEAMTVNSQEVIATNRRLIVNDSGAEPVSIPYEMITRITRYVEFPWQALLAGLALSGLLLAGMVLHLPIIGGIPRAAQSLLGLDSAPIPPYVIPITISLVPALAGLAVSAARLKQGYLVHMTGSGVIFLPKQFLRVLRTINRLASQEVMKD